MSHVNIEIKAHCPNPRAIRETLRSHNAEFRGRDRQVDTYFNCFHGRLKLREGNIEVALIHYHRPNRAGPKQADVSLYHPADDVASLKATLTAALGVMVVVEKIREIYFIDNVKFHIDTVEPLGHFVEIEAIATDPTHTPETLRQQCDHYLSLFAISDNDLATHSYSDMLMG